MRLFAARTSRWQRLADEELIEAAARGVAEAFEVIYDRHAQAAYSLAYRIAGSVQVAEDIVQEAMLAAWRGASAYDARRGTVRAWLLRIVHNRAIDLLRRRAVQERLQSGEALDPEAGAGRDPERASSEEQQDPMVEALRRERARAVGRALQALPEDQRRVVELAYYGGFTHTEIAEILGTPVGTVKGRMRLALEKLRGLEPVLEQR
ncbi:MAG: sigma-70 family RNA polymerase sigma factor [Thermoleophilum sp.]|nr:sigma-70 family RNA polymerase sigma factor [Thermoleophilum sp.]